MKDSKAGSDYQDANLYYTPSMVAAIAGVSNNVVERWLAKGLISSFTEKGLVRIPLTSLSSIPPFPEILSSPNLYRGIPAKHKNTGFTCIELFAGAGGLALGLENAGFSSLLLNEIDTDAVATLRHNRPQWNVVHSDIQSLCLSDYKGRVDLLSGGFPCQAFSHAGKRLGFEDTRGTLFFEMARCISECSPRIVLAENVKGLVSHDEGRTLKTIIRVLNELGYVTLPPRVLKALLYNVPQKRERLIIVAFRKDISDAAIKLFDYPFPYGRIYTLRDAFFAGELYPTDVPISEGLTYPEKKKRILDLVPMGGFWKNLPDAVQREYMGANYFSGGGKTGVARRLSLDEPSLTLTCSPAQKQTERCHPLETRPLTVREYARIQTFPDEWKFQGRISSQYKQIGNAVPVNLARAIGESILHLLESISK